MRYYQSYKDTDFEWIGRIPSHWEIAKLKRFSLVVNGSTPNTSNPDYWDGDIIWITPLDLGKLNGKLFIAESSRKISKNGLDNCGASLTPIGSIIISSRAPIGHLAISSNVSCTNQGCKTLVIDKNRVLNTFLYYCILAFKNVLQSYGQGTTFVELSSQNLKDFLTIYPPLYEQQAIADYLDRKTVQIDTLIAKKQHLIELLQEYRTALINQAVTKGLDPNVPMKDSGYDWLGKIPEHWEMKKLKYLSKVNFSNVDKHSFEYEIPIQLCNYVDVYKNDFIHTNLNFMKATAKENEIEKFQLIKGDVLITKDSETWEDIAVPAYVTENIDNVICGYHLAQIRPLSINGNYLFWVLNSPSINDQYKVEAHGITRYGLGKGAIENSFITCPPNNEQQEIFNYLNNKTSQIDKLIMQINKEIHLYNEFRTSLVSDTVTGKIDVRNQG